MPFCHCAMRHPAGTSAVRTTGDRRKDPSGPSATSDRLYENARASRTPQKRVKTLVGLSNGRIIPAWPP